jgi:hypothetical protein
VLIVQDIFELIAEAVAASCSLDPGIYRCPARRVDWLALWTRVLSNVNLPVASPFA